MSNFSRNISDFGMLKNQLLSNEFLQRLNVDLIQTGQAFFAFRNEEATVYYKGNQLCNLAASNGYAPTIYNHYLPITRSQTISGSRKKSHIRSNNGREPLGVQTYHLGMWYPK